MSRFFARRSGIEPRAPIKGNSDGPIDGPGKFVKAGETYVGGKSHNGRFHLHRNTAEFDFPYSNKDVSDCERADKALIGIAGKRLTYRRADKLAA